MLKRSASVYLLLALAWLVIVAWQAFEHERFKQRSQEQVRERAIEISSTLGVSIRNMRGRFGGIPQSRLEATLSELIKINKLQAVMLLNTDGDTIASSGTLVGLSLDNLPQQRLIYSGRMATFRDLIDLGSRAQNDTATSASANRGGRPPRDFGRIFSIIVLPEDNSPDRRPGPPDMERRGRPARPEDGSTSRTHGMGPGPGPGEHFDPGFAPPPRGGGRPRGDDEAFRKQQGLHGLLLQMPIESYRAEERHDLWLRLTTMAIALLAAGGLGVAWRNVDRMNRLQIRLMRASEMNSHLQELNIAAAGLAHETRNPLNIVRGLAQLISHSATVNTEFRQKASDIIGEVDRVTGRLNEFINYSRSPVPRPTHLRLLAVIGDVRRALESDLTEKEIQCEVRGPDLLINADESLLRQVFFNLLINSIQAVGQGGQVEIIVQNGHAEASFSVRDNGPGVPLELRNEIFKPYFTTRTEGTGLGLAVVRQIVLAHHWDIDYAPGENGGAGFRISGLKVI